MELTAHEIESILRISPQFRLPVHVDHLLRLIKDVEFFHKIILEQGSDDLPRECCKVMSLEQCNQDDIVFNFGDKGKKFYIILDGSVSVKIPSNSKVLVNENDINKIESISKFENDSNSEDQHEDEKIDIKFLRKSSNLKININKVLNNFSTLNRQKKFEVPHKNGILNAESKKIFNLFKHKAIQEQKVLMNFIKKSDKDTVQIETHELEEIGVLNKGSSFGEVALISHKPRCATIQCLEKSSFLVLYKSDFIRILGDIAEKRLNSIVKFLQDLNYFNSYNKISLIRLGFYFQHKKYKRNQFIYKEGDPIDGVYFIKSGEIIITKKKPVKFTQKSSPFSSPSNFSKKRVLKKFQDVKIIIKGSNESLGGYEVIQELLSRETTCICTSLSCELYFISKDNFLVRIHNIDPIKEMILSKQERLIQRYKELCEEVPEIQLNKSVTPQKSIASRYSTEKKTTGSISNQYYKSAEKVKNRQTHRSFIRKLTELEIHEAINGRPEFARKYTAKANLAQFRTIRFDNIVRK